MNRLGVGGNYVCYLVIVVIFIGLRRSKRERGLKSSYEGKLNGESHKVEGKASMGVLFMGELTPQVFYHPLLI